MKTMHERIEEALSESFTIEKLNIVNESAKHRGHAGHDGSDQSHFKVEIKARELAGLGRIEAQRAVNVPLKNLYDQGLHALSLRILA